MALPKWIIPPTPEEVRKRFDYHVLQWKDIREEAKTDMRVLSGDPWPPEERAWRKGRLNLDFDELSQYINQLVNQVRQNKRAPKVTPVGNGANDQTAEMVAGLIKAIGYKSNADAARITAFSCAAERSYGYYKIVREYVSDTSDEQELRIRRIPNPDVIYLDPDAKEADFSDMTDAFELDKIGYAEFKRRFKNAQTVDFSSEYMTAAPAWIQAEELQLATYWKSHINKRTRYRLDSTDEPEVYADELPEGDGVNEDRMLERKGMKSVKVRGEREIKDRFVVAYLTNGIEILETRPWTVEVTNPQTGKKTTGGRIIPIIPILGKELWIDQGSGARRALQSLIRLARTPYMAYCYTRTAQLEAIQLTSKSPYFVIEGQFENHEEEAKALNKIPTAYQYYKGWLPDQPAGVGLLPAPQRPSYIPEVQMLEIYAQAARRAIQSAVGQNNPQQQRNSTSPLSGKALEEFQSQGELSTFHFIDNYDRALELEGRILKDLIPVVYDTERQVSIIAGNEKAKVVTLNAQPGTNLEYGQPQQGQPPPTVEYPTDEGDHDLTISVGPSMDSERDQAQNFSDLLVQNPQLVTLALQNPQSTAAQLLGQAIRLKDLGPIGDAMAEIIDPSKNKQQQLPPQVQQMMQQQAQQLQAAVAMVGNLQQELKEKTTIAQMEMDNKRAIAADKNRTDVIIQMLKSGAQGVQAQLDAYMQSIETRFDKLHESELAPGPDEGSPGLHPTIPPMPAAQNGAGSSEPAPTQ